MADASASRTTVTCSGVVTVRQRPSLLLMKVRVRATEATLELGLAKLKEQHESTSRWLTRLGAVRVECGEPHFADQAEQDAMTRSRAATAKAMRKLAPGAARPADHERGVRAVLTATWEIGSMSAEETLVLVDRLRFEAAEDAGEPEPTEPTPPWASPEEQIQKIMMAQVQQLTQPPEDDGAPVFLFVARLDTEQLEKAAAAAFSRARENAERLARAAGMQLGQLGSLHVGHAVDHARPDRLMDRHRCAALLAGCSYEPGEHEAVSDDPRAAEFAVSVSVSYSLQ
jgi:hypothetical protein